MGRFFSDRVETALKYIYYDMGAGRGQEGFQLLQEAVWDGDADACCLLARCLYGPEYTWAGHDFPVDEQTGDELMRRSVLGGSAIGTLLSLRSGVMDRQLAQAMPFGSLQEAFDLVEDKAEHGEPFCQMLHRQCVLLGRFCDSPGAGAGRILTARTPFRAFCGKTTPGVRTGCGGPIGTASPSPALTCRIFIRMGSRG